MNGQTPVVITDLRIPFFRLMLFFVKAGLGGDPGRHHRQPHRDAAGGDRRSGAWRQSDLHPPPLDALTACLDAVQRAAARRRSGPGASTKFLTGGSISARGQFAANVR